MNPFLALVEQPLVLLLAVLVIVLGVGRLSRVVTWDSYPPAIAIRERWLHLTGEYIEETKAWEPGPWTKLLTCFWCFTPWLMLLAGGWFVLGLYVVWVAWIWWAFWSWLALSYVASMILARDEP